MQRYKSIIEYDGTNYCGWQRQKNALAVQQVIEEALYKLTNEDIQVFASGRTDAGVHAKGQVMHFDSAKNFDDHKITSGLNHHIRTDEISIVNTQKTDQEFHSRFSAKKRYYKYLILNRPSRSPILHNRAWHIGKQLDINAMREASTHLLGNHDFTSFRASECQAQSPIKTIDQITINQLDENIIEIKINALSFLHHMVRNIVGTLKDFGTAKYQPEYMIDIIQAKNRATAGATAPACGLYFMKTDY